MSSAGVAASRKGFLAKLLGQGSSYWVIAVGAALLAVFGTLTILGNATATTTYYVLNQDVAARTQITPEMVTGKTVNVGGQPANALDITDLQSGQYFARVPLKAGDAVTSSTVGPLERITTSVPDGYVVASLQVEPENAVAGKVRAGDLIDVIAVDEAGNSGATAKVVLHRVLVLDVTTNPDNIAQAATTEQVGDDLPGPESNQVRGGIPMLYTVAVSPQDAAKLALIRDKHVMIVLSANKSSGSLDASVSIGDVFGAGPVSASTTTDSKTPTEAEPNPSASPQPQQVTESPGS